MKQPNFSAEYLRTVLDYDPLGGEFRTKKATSNSLQVGEIRGCLRSTGYLAIRVKNRLYQAHNLAWYHFYGVWPSSPPDHKNRTRSDNRIRNLRAATHSQNVVNTGVRSTNNSGFKGVSCSRSGKWRARITINGVEHQLGVFESKMEAAQAYRSKALSAFGEFAETAQLQR